MHYLMHQFDRSIYVVCCVKIHSFRSNCSFYFLSYSAVCQLDGVCIVSSALVDEVRRQLFTIHCQHQQLGLVHPKLTILCRIITDQLTNGVSLVSLAPPSDAYISID